MRQKIPKLRGFPIRTLVAGANKRITPSRSSVQAQQVKDLEADAITAKKETLPGTAERKNARPVINFNTLFGTYNI